MTQNNPLKAHHCTERMHYFILLHFMAVNRAGSHRSCVILHRDLFGG